jgi:hypothetical protein
MWVDPGVGDAYISLGGSCEGKLKASYGFQETGELCFSVPGMRFKMNCVGWYDACTPLKDLLVLSVKCRFGRNASPTHARANLVQIPRAIPGH